MLQRSNINRFSIFRGDFTKYFLWVVWKHFNNDSFLGAHTEKTANDGCFNFGDHFNDAIRHNQSERGKE